MASISDGLTEVLQKMKETDERLQARINTHVQTHKRLLAELKDTLEKTD